MKKILLTAMAVAVTSFVFSQQLPAKVKLELSDKQILTLDSAAKEAAASIDSKTVTRRLDLALYPIWLQVREQLIVAKPKEDKPVDKPTDKKGTGKP